MGLQFKFDILQALKDKGWNTGRLRAENAEARARGEKGNGLSEDTIQRLRKGNPISWANIENLCKKLELQPGDFLEYVPDGLTDTHTNNASHNDFITRIMEGNNKTEEANRKRMYDLKT